MKLPWKKSRVYHVSWYTDHSATGKPIFGQSEIFLSKKWSLGCARDIAAYIRDSIEEDTGPVVILGFKYIGKYHAEGN